VTFSLSMVGVNHFYFVFWLSFNKVRWWIDVVRSMCIVFSVQGEESDVEQRVYFPLFWEF
jgi:hypothetical protein